jgi:hypothetical protein
MLNIWLLGFNVLHLTWGISRKNRLKEVGTN